MKKLAPKLVNKTNRLLSKLGNDVKSLKTKKAAKYPHSKFSWLDKGKITQKQVEIKV